ncbi:hypothetical protein BYT27DRAFT_7249202 [Phlegmacium glaucopus]|nr:hypothetical protein BYT27DRAFT_7249202 [Phlegmacium glaucopus]
MPHSFLSFGTSSFNVNNHWPRKSYNLSRINLEPLVPPHLLLDEVESWGGLHRLICNRHNPQVLRGDKDAPAPRFAEIPIFDERPLPTPIWFVLVLFQFVSNIFHGSSPLPQLQNAGLLKALLLVTPLILNPLTDVSEFYHTIRGRDTIKMFNALEDRLYASNGH